MASTSIKPPYEVFPDVDGDPLKDGYIYIGLPGLNPESNPVTAYWDLELTIPAAQPVRTIGGFPSRDGAPGTLYVDGDYSVLVKNKNGSLVYSALNNPFKADAESISAGDGSDGSLWTTVQGYINYILSSAGSSAVGFIQAAAAAVGRTVQDKLRESVSVLDFGAVGDGVTDDTNAIASAVAAWDNIIFPPGNYSVGDLTIPKNVSVKMHSGAYFTVSDLATLSILGEFDSPIDEHLFRGDGDVLGLSTVRPEWFGAAGDGTTDDSVAFNKMSACVESSSSSVRDYPRIILSNKQYGLSESWVVNIGSNQSLVLEGSGPLLDGSRLIGLDGFDSTNGGVLAVEGSDNSITRIANFVLKNFAIISETAGGVDLGVTFNHNQDNFLIGLHESLVENIHVENCTYGFWLSRTRLINFNRCSVWNDGIESAFNTCLQVRDATSGASFSGDLTFTDCQFVGHDTNGLAYGVYLETNSSGSNLAGIRFNNCIWYGSNYSAYVHAAVGATIGDVWFTHCQFDEIGSSGVYLYQEDSGSAGFIVDVHVKDCYFTAAASNCVRAVADKAGGINALTISDNYCAGTGNAAVELQLVNGAVVSDNMWTGVTWAPGQALSFVGCNYITAIGNNFGQGGIALAGGFTSMVQLSGTGDYYVITGNNSAGLATGTLINNLTGAANTAIANNI